MDAFLSQLTLAMDRIINGLALDHLHSFSVHGLLQAVSGYHVQLTNAILKMGNGNRSIF